MANVVQHHIDPSVDAPHTAPSFIPPRTSSHGVAFPNSPPLAVSSLVPAENRAPPRVTPPRKSSKRPVSTTSENWLAQSSGKKAVTSRSRSHSHRPKSASGHREWTALSSKPELLDMSPNPPPEDPPKNIGDHLIHTKQSWSSEKEKILLSPYVYLCKRPGKDVRTQIISAFNAWLKVPPQKLDIITKVVGMLHTSSLLVDDVEDFSILRRGAPVAHNIFGVPQVINSANYVYFLALQEVMTLNNPQCIQIFTEELLNLHRGQGMDLFWRDNLKCPTEDDYLEMVSNKTGGLFRLAIKLMEAESTLLHPEAASAASADTTAGSTIRQVPEDPVQANTAASSTPQTGISCVPLINTIGMLFQILDDLLNLCSTAYHARKGLAEDLTEGKFSFPIIHAIRADPSDMVLLNILRQKTTDAEVKQYAVEYMEKIGSFEYTRRVIADLERKAVKEVASLEARVGGRDGKDGGEKIRVILGKLKAL